MTTDQWKIKYKKWEESKTDQNKMQQQEEIRGNNILCFKQNLEQMITEM